MDGETSGSTKGRSRLARFFTADESAAGRVALSWAIAGGFVVGGFMMVAATVSGGADAASIPFTATTLFVVGALGGFVHGSVLGVAGRPADVTCRNCLGGVEMAALLAIPALLVAWVATLWLAMTSVALTVGSLSILLGAVTGGVLGLAAIIWALVEGRAAVAHALARWPEHRPGAALIVMTFTTLLISFVLLRPEIWWTNLEVSGLGAVLLALGATFWIGVPIVVVTLHFLHQWLADSPVWDL